MGPQRRPGSDDLDEQPGAGIDVVAGRGRVVGRPQHQDDGWWNHQQLRSRGNTIEAGTSEVLRNIIAERVLGLPRSR